jgi:hypothetical protein
MGCQRSGEAWTTRTLSCKTWDPSRAICSLQVTMHSNLKRSLGETTLFHSLTSWLILLMVKLPGLTRGSNSTSLLFKNKSYKWLQSYCVLGKHICCCRSPLRSSITNLKRTQITGSLNSCSSKFYWNMEKCQTPRWIGLGTTRKKLEHLKISR